jgi:translation initiation factor 1
MAKNKNNSPFVYSTNPDFDYGDNNKSHQETLPPTQQKLIVQKSVKGRGGKVATLVTGFVGKEADLEVLGKLLKNKCGVGGSVKDGEILIQGDHRNKAAEILTKEGYKVKVSGG